MTMFRPATKAKSRARIALDGPAGGGKTLSALRAAAAFGKEGKYPRVAVINTESGAIEKYLGLSLDGVLIAFDVCELPNFAPTSYVTAIREAGRAKYDVLIIDSLSHAWTGKDGALEQVSRKGGNSFTAWKDVTPQHNELIEAILQCPCHVIVTMRSKTEYVLEESTNSQGKPIQVPKRIGMAPIQRQGMEYEFDIVGDLDLSHTLTISKTRCPEIDGAVVVKPGAAFWIPVAAWLADGVDRVVKPPANGQTSARNDPRNGPELERPTPQPTPLPANGPATEQQISEVHRLLDFLGMPADIRAESLRRKGIEQWSEMTFAQAEEALGKMRAMELGYSPIPASWNPKATPASGGSDTTPPFDTDTPGPPSAESLSSHSTNTPSTAAA